MSDRLERLRGTVRELEQELRELDTLDPVAREVLEQAAHDIHAALSDRALSDRVSGDPVAATSLSGRLQDAAREFESTHPTLAGVLERVIDALGQLGI